MRTNFFIMYENKTVEHFASTQLVLASDGHLLTIGDRIGPFAWRDMATIREIAAVEDWA
jgi:hypothetical protein